MRGSRYVTFVESLGPFAYHCDDKASILVDNLDSVITVVCNIQISYFNETDATGKPDTSRWYQHVIAHECTNYITSYGSYDAIGNVYLPNSMIISVCDVNFSWWISYNTVR